MREEILIAFRQALQAQLLGIEQVDAELTEDIDRIVLIGHTADDDVTYVASFPVPVVDWRRA